MRVGLVLAAAAAAMLLAAGARAGSSGPMMRGDGGSVQSAASTRYAISPDSATLLIAGHGRAWSLDGGLFRAHQQATLGRGATLTVIDGGVPPHEIVEVTGRPVKMRRGTTMSGRAVTTTVVFVEAGIYRFRAAAGLSVAVKVR